MAPNIDRNKAPETWITAAPFDTITLDKNQRPRIGVIPIRFHLYWAGSDQDGAVVGYYWAVTDTTPSIARLPGPKAADYRYTTRSDTTFIFEVAEDIPDRLHVFYIYAVDDQGKPDPTPARFVFDAQDRFPPLPVFDVAQATGTIYYFDAGVLKSEKRTFTLTDTVNYQHIVAPKDTVPSGSQLTFRFHGEPTVAGGVIRGFRYKLDEPQLQPTEPESLYRKNVLLYHVPPDSADPARKGGDLLTVAPGTKVFTLRAVDNAGGSRDGNRRFQYNFSPETWWAGPDTTGPGLTWTTNALGERFIVYVASKLPDTGVPGTLMGPDSVQILPSARKPNRTFLEVWKDTLFLRREGDTVHLGSWVILHNGGFDTDSPYAAKVADGIAAIQPSFPGGPVLTPGPANGSPIGFRFLITDWLYPDGPLAFSAQSLLYPFFDPNDVFNFQKIGAYAPMNGAGTAYALARAEDGDGARDGRVGDARQVVEYPRDAYDVSLRPLVMVWNVDFPPVLQTSNPAFRPRTTAVDTFVSRDWDVRLYSDDRDPWISGDTPGGPSGTKTLRIHLTVTGKDTAGANLVYREPANLNHFDQTFNLLVPCNLGTGPATLTVELCDCAVCVGSYAGEGRCITKDIRVYYKRPASASVGCGPVAGPGTLGSRPTVSRSER